MKLLLRDKVAFDSSSILFQTSVSKQFFKANLQSGACNFTNNGFVCR